MSTLSAILSPDFLLRDALIGSVLVGLICPLVGVYFVLRRMIFLGVALPFGKSFGSDVGVDLYYMLQSQLGKRHDWSSNHILGTKWSMRW